MPGGWGWRSKSRSPLKCAVYNVTVSALSPYLKQTIIGMYSYLVHRCPIGFSFNISGTIPRGGAKGQNLGHII